MAFLFTYYYLLHYYRLLSLFIHSLFLQMIILFHYHQKVLFFILFLIFAKFIINLNISYRNNELFFLNLQSFSHYFHNDIFYVVWYLKESFTYFFAKRLTQFILSFIFLVIFSLFYYMELQSNHLRVDKYFIMQNFSAFTWFSQGFMLNFLVEGMIKK